MNIFMSEPTLHDPYLGRRTVMTIVLLAVLAITQQWPAFVAVIVMLAIWKRSSAPKESNDD